MMKAMAGKTHLKRIERTVACQSQILCFSSSLRKSAPLVLMLLLFVATADSAHSQAASATPVTQSAESTTQSPKTLPGLSAYRGKTVVAIDFTGVDRSLLEPLPADLPQQPGQLLDSQKLHASLRRLYATGLYDSIDLEAQTVPGGVRILFAGTPRSFFGAITIAGVKSDRLAAQLSRSTGIDLGTPYSPDAVAKGTAAIQQSLQTSGFYQSKVTARPAANAVNGVRAVTYTVDTGKQARVGDVTSTGTPALNDKQFRRVSKLKRNSKLTQDTTRTAIKRLRAHYQKEDRLEAKITQNKEQFQPLTDHMDFGFEVVRGPIVTFVVDGGHVSRGKLQSLVPVFQEGTVDQDLLNEGSRHLRDYFQAKGYFDATIQHSQQDLPDGREQITYTVDKGSRHRVESVHIQGNKYFDSDTLRERLSVTKADPLIRYGRYTENLVNNDVEAITNLYAANGFRDVKVTPEIQDDDKNSKRGKKMSTLSVIHVVYKVEEGPQSKFGKVQITGDTKIPEADLRKLMNSQQGQPYSLLNLSGDRDAMLNYYLSKGFANAQMDVTQSPEKEDPKIIDVTFRATEGDQAFINQILISGLHYTRRFVVDHELQVHSGAPLDESALLETQRRLYDLALFNEVDTAVENPTGDQPRKNILIDLQEAKRWDFTYGIGLQAQTGNPNQNCPSVATLIQLGIDPTTYHCSPAGSTGASELVSFDATRINFRGRDQSITLHTIYGSLEQAATLIFNNPHYFGNPNLSFSLSGGYTSNQDVTTFASSRLEADVQVQQVLGRTASRRPLDTLIYRFTYRRVKVDPQSIQVAADEIPLLSEPARVGGPGFTFIRDRRDNPLDAHHGNYFTAQTFLSSSLFASQSDFVRVDATQSSYYSFGKRHYVLARSTRYGAEASYGSLNLRTVPLPERLFAGGATSHRGFAINQAGPRDTQTGYPLGGGGAFVNTVELRTPPADLPVVGNSLSFVVFHDMGNVFTEPGQVFGSFFNWKQPDTPTCRNLAVTGGLCNFNYMSHALGLGLRYATPIGPVRVDLSDNLNPPVYPILVDPTNGPHVGQLSHFNFFFSIGQSF
jgi:outer membrane protein assembly factor BamA